MSYRRRYATRLLRATKTPFRQTPTVRFGPRPSQRPSRASWPLTKTLDFLSRPLPLPRPCANADVDNRHSIRMQNAILNSVILIKTSPSAKKWGELSCLPQPDSDTNSTASIARPVLAVAITIRRVNRRIGITICIVRLRISIRRVTRVVIRLRVTVRVVLARIIRLLIVHVRSRLIDNDPTSAWSNDDPLSLREHAHGQ